MPQGYKNSHTTFYEALHEDLGEYRVNKLDVTLVHYIDEFLVEAETKE